MPPEALKVLLDILSALADIRTFTSGMDLQGYRANPMCRAAVERKFEVIGEACTRLRDRFPETFTQLTSGHRIIGLRNRLIHGYDSVDDAIVWDVVMSKLPVLAAELEALNADQ
jgi:uncharacterized protein with HEPN domain